MKELIMGLNNNALNVSYISFSFMKLKKKKKLYPMF